MTDLWTELERQFQEQLAGTTKPRAPEPVTTQAHRDHLSGYSRVIQRAADEAYDTAKKVGGHDQLPRPWTAREGAEL